jgi:hypothetical protein
MIFDALDYKLFCCCRALKACYWGWCENCASKALISLLEAYLYDVLGMHICTMSMVSGLRFSFVSIQAGAWS